MELIDTHAHLYLDAFDGDRKTTVQNAFAVGVGRILLPNIDGTSVEALLKIAGEFPGHCYPMMGLHPTSVSVDNMENELKRVEEELGRRKYYAIGETGIDLYWDKTHYAEQEKAFIRQLMLARDHRLPVVIHSRNSLNEIFGIFKVQKIKDVGGVFHCFPGNSIQAKQAVDLGFYLGIGGVVTYKNSWMARVVEDVSLDHLVLETDAPFLPPVPHRGQRNESAWLTLVAAKVAQIKNITPEEVAEATTRNAKKLFAI
jgi:TatD DNase family protein